MENSSPKTRPWNELCIVFNLAAHEDLRAARKLRFVLSSRIFSISLATLPDRCPPPMP